ncbi:hypothetical protein [Ktedonosporobacter rubrisoli]|uniref:hypothetical protein n=1 Tax=Ktedonosporobacter rubrisoli TaxID=2509675 RepID=UPI001F5DFB4F|nr:hypothetical protein [Ktedonosporobacter rubrisoli]
MQIQLHHIAGGEGGLRQIREEQFVDHTCSCDAHGTLLLPCGMGGYDHATGHAIRSDRDRGTIVEATHHQAFGALLELIRGEVQTRLNEWVIEQAIVLATGHKREPSEIGKHGPIAILSIESEQCAFL